MENNLRIRGIAVSSFLEMKDDSHGILKDTQGNDLQHFELKEGIISLVGPNAFDNDEVEVCQIIGDLYFQSAKEDYAGIEIDNETANELDKAEYDTEEIEPFDPEDLSIETKLITMETILRRLEKKTILLNPDFQRQEVWDEVRKSQLIESLMLNIPIPMFYVSSDEKGNWSVVDGLQRISTFRDFVLGEAFIRDPEKNRDEMGKGMALTGLEFWKNLNGLTMNELPPHLYSRIRETVFTFTIVNPGTHEEVKRNIFKRLNTGGMPLSSQEIRNALYTGYSTILLNELAQTEEFKDATCNSIHALRMEDRELVLRFVAFLVRHPSTYKRTLNIDTWLSDTMIILNSLPSLDTRELKKCIQQKTVNVEDIELIDREEIRAKFRIAMRRAMQLFGRHAFRKSTGTMRRRPINKSLFEIWSVLLCELTESEFDVFYKNRNNMEKEYRAILDDPIFEIAISRDSMRHTSVALRYNKLKELVNKYSVES